MQLERQTMLIKSQLPTLTQITKYTETVNITVTDDALGDTGSVRVDSEYGHTGRSAIQLNQDDGALNLLDFSTTWSGHAITGRERLHYSPWWQSQRIGFLL